MNINILLLIVLGISGLALVMYTSYYAYSEEREYKKQMCELIEDVTQANKNLIEIHSDLSDRILKAESKEE